MKHTPKTPMYPIFDRPIKEEDFKAPKYFQITEIGSPEEYKDYWESLCWPPNLLGSPFRSWGVNIRGNVYVIKGMAFGVYPKDYTAPLPSH